MKEMPLSNSKRRVLQWMVTVVLSAMLVGPCHARSASNATILTLTNQPRPVMQAILELISKFDCVITYEDPRYVYQGDLKDVTQEHRHLDKFPAGTAPKVFIPVGGGLQMTLPSATRISDQAMDDLLRQLVESWLDSNQGGGHYQVQQEQDVFHIVPTEVRDKSGNWQPTQSILANPISLATASRDDWQTYKAIGRAIGAATDVKIVTIVNGGLILGGSPVAKQYVIGAQNESAESVLIRAFKIMGKKRTWLLTYEPTTEVYFLNIDDVSGLSDVHGTPPTAGRSVQSSGAPAVAPPARNSSAPTRNCRPSIASPPCGV